MYYKKKSNTLGNDSLSCFRKKKSIINTFSKKSFSFIGGSLRLNFKLKQFRMSRNFRFLHPFANFSRLSLVILEI